MTDHADDGGRGGADSNPYAFPYFHSDGSCPLLYRLILEVEELRDDGNILHTDTNTNDDNDDSNDDAAEVRRRMKATSDLLRRIKSRCIVRPAEVGWTDSCGENALHRLCQAARFGIAVDEGQQAAATNAESSAEVHRVHETGRRGARTTGSSQWDDLVISVARCLVDAAPGAIYISARNSWREMPLHQFAAHCGIGVGVGSRTITNGDGEGEGDTDNDDTAPLLPDDAAKRMLSLLLTSCPESASARNYLLSLPLHEACTLPAGPDVLVRDCIRDLITDRSVAGLVGRSGTDADGRGAAEVRRMRRRHSSAVAALLAVQPRASFAVDKMGRTPIYRAVESERTGAGVVRVLIEGVEGYCRDRSGLDWAETRNVVRALVVGRTGKSRRTREERRDGNDYGENTWAEESANDGYMSMLEARGWIRQQVHPWSRGSASADDDDEHLSPLGFLWDAWVWTPRSVNVADTESNTTTASRTTVSALVRAALSRRDADPGRIARQLGPLWEKAELLVRAAHWGTAREEGSGGERGERRWRLVHSAVALSCPSAVVELAARLHPEQLVERDEDGHTPLLLAASVPPRDNRSRGETVRRQCEGLGEGKQRPDTGDDDNGGGSSLLRLLVLADGGACRMTNRDGRLPMHVAIENGHSWDDLALQEILAAEPRSVRARDPVTHFVPFMLAAVVAADADAGNPPRQVGVACESLLEESIDAGRTTTIFELLKADPSVLSHL